MEKTYQRYPAMRYHQTLAPDGREVKDAAADAALGEGWVKTPAAFEPGYVDVPEPEEGTSMDTAVALTQEYIPYPALRYTREGGELIVNSAEEDQELDPRVWKKTPDPAAWADEAPAPVADPASALTPPAVPPVTAVNPIAASLYLLNVAESELLVNGADTPAKLDVIEHAEKAHPKHEGGRVSVLRAIADRREALAQAPV